MATKVSPEICAAMTDYELTNVSTYRQIRVVQLYFENGGDWEKAYCKVGYVPNTHPSNIPGLVKDFLKSPVIQELAKRKRKQLNVSASITDDFIVLVLQETLERCRIKGDTKGINRCLSELSKIKATYALDKASIKEKAASTTAWADSMQASESEEKIKDGANISEIAELLTFSNSDEQTDVGALVEKALLSEEEKEE